MLTDISTPCLSARVDNNNNNNVICPMVESFVNGAAIDCISKEAKYADLESRRLLWRLGTHLCLPPFKRHWQENLC